MLSYQRDSGAKLLKSYLPPFQGTWKTLPPYLLPDDVVQDSLNICLSGGVVTHRSGLSRFNLGGFDARIIGSFLTVDTTDTKYPLVSSEDKVYRWKTNIWEDITGTATLAASGVTQVRMTSIQIGTSVYVLYANGVDTLKVIPESTYQMENITPVSGSIPRLKDVCTSFSRLIGIIPPYTVTWSDPVNDNYLAFRSWPSLNQYIASDTEDSLVAIRPLGTLGVALYKEGNIFVGFAQSGTNAAAFRFEYRGEYEGPAGVQAVVNVNGAHMYMTATGRIALFDGTRHNWLCDGLWPFLQGDVDRQYSSHIFGVYDYRTSQVLFWYPKVGDNGECKGMLIINLPFPLAGIQNYSYFLGQTNFSCSNGLSVRLFNTQVSPFIFSDTGHTYVLDKDIDTDNSAHFNCEFTTGLFRPINEDVTVQQDVYYPSVEVYSDRGETVIGVVDVTLLTSNVLEDAGKHSSAVQVDLAHTPINEFIGFTDSGSFLGVKFAWRSTDKFRYKGCDVYGIPIL